MAAFQHRFDVRGLVNTRDMKNIVNCSPIEDGKITSFEKQLDLERFADLKEEESDHEDGKLLVSYRNELI